MKRTRVQLDMIVTDTFEAMVNEGEYWNGFSCPYFERKEADRFVDAFNKAISNPDLREMGIDMMWAFYNDARDAYVFPRKDGEAEVFGKVSVDGVAYYPIGARAWCWTEPDGADEPEKKFCDLCEATAESICTPEFRIREASVWITMTDMDGTVIDRTAVCSECLTYVKFRKDLKGFE